MDLVKKKMNLAARRTDIAYTYGSRCLQCACPISPSHPLHSHVSCAVISETTFPSAPSSSNSSRLVSTGQAHFRTSGGEFYLADSTHATSMKGSCSRQCSTTWNGQTKATRTSIGINPEKRQHLRQKIQPGHWCFFGPASERTWWNANSNEPQGQWDTVSLQMVVMFKCHTSHPVFPATEPLYQW